MAFLTIFNSEKNNRKTFEFNEMSFEFNFKRQTFIFATTESDKIFPPLKDRLTTVDFEPYTQLELAQIVKLCTPEILYINNTLNDVASTVRNNARSAVKRSKEITLYCGAKDTKIFGKVQFSDLCDQVGHTTSWFNIY